MKKTCFFGPFGVGAKKLALPSWHVFFSSESLFSAEIGPTAVRTGFWLGKLIPKMLLPEELVRALYQKKTSEDILN